MRENVIRTSRRYGQLTFMAAVTACLLAFVFIQAAKGPGGVPGVVVYALGAGFGLEFVSAAWTGRWRERPHRPSVHH
jgi:hypothetical protein